MPERSKNIFTDRQETGTIFDLHNGSHGFVPYGRPSLPVGLQNDKGRVGEPPQAARRWKLLRAVLLRRSCPAHRRASFVSSFASRLAAASAPSGGYAELRQKPLRQHQNRQQKTRLITTNQTWVRSITHRQPVSAQSWTASTFPDTSW